jgi:hypothetical protein
MAAYACGESLEVACARTARVHPVRFAAAFLCWLVATIALAAAVPAGWAERNLISSDGYAALSSSAAGDPALRNAMASLLAAQAARIGRDKGYNVDDDAVHKVAVAYTASPSFPRQFADANRIAHQWLFSGTAQQNGDSWEINVSPMLSDTSIAQTLNDYRVQVPSSVNVPVTDDTARTLRPGQLRPFATWGTWVSLGTAVLAGAAALLTIATARSRGKAIAALGISALLVGGAGYAMVEIGHRFVKNALNQTTGNVRAIADVMVAHAEDGLHRWLNLTLAAGAGLVVFGVIVTMLGAWLGKQHRSSATGTRTSAQL